MLDDAGPLRTQIEAMLRVVEETVPVQRIWLDTAEAKETPLNGFAAEPPAAVMEVLKVMFSGLVHRKGLSASVARERLLHTEPFNAWPDLVASLEEPS